MVLHLPSLLLARYLCFFVLAFLFNPSLPGVWAVENVTVYDQDPSIVYSPAGAWVVSANSSLDFGGSHMLTQNPNATAVFRFTGIAIYFLSPLWPYLVNTAVSLDGGPVTLIDLVDHTHNDTGSGPETVQWHVVWNATDLNDTQHVLNISVGVGQPFAIVDGLIYTDPNATASTSSMSPPSSTTSSSAPASNTSSSTTDRIVASSTSTALSDLSPSSSKRIIPVLLGTILGIFGVFLLMIGMWFFFRRRRRPVSEAWTAGDGSVSGGGGGQPPPPPIGANGYRGPPHGYPMAQTTQGAWQNGKYGYVGMPPPPIPAGQYAHDPNPSSPSSRAPNRYQPGYTLSTITEKSTPHSRRTPLAANTPASVQSELAGVGSGVGYYSPPAAPSEVGSEGSRAGPGLAGIGAGLRGVAEQPQPQPQQQHYYYSNGNGTGAGNMGRTGYSGSSSSSTAVASGSGQSHSDDRRHGKKARQGTNPNLNPNANGSTSGSSHWI